MQTAMPLPEEVTIHCLRRALALQLARAIRERAVTQAVLAKHLDVPQPTLSKLLNGRVDGLSIELLIRIAVRAGVSVTLYTGDAPEKAGAHARSHRQPPRGKSKLAAEARRSQQAADRRLTPSQRLAAFLEHNQLLAERHRAGRAAAKPRVSKTRSAPRERAGRAIPGRNARRRASKNST